MFVSDLAGPIKSGDVLETNAQGVLQRCRKRGLDFVPGYDTCIGWRVVVAAEDMDFVCKPVELGLVWAATPEQFMQMIELGLVNKVESVDDLSATLHGYRNRKRTIQDTWVEDALLGGRL